MSPLSVESALLAVFRALGRPDTDSALAEARYRMVCNTEPMVIYSEAGAVAATNISALVGSYIEAVEFGGTLSPQLPIPGIPEVSEPYIDPSSAAHMWARDMLYAYWMGSEPVNRERLEEYVIALAYDLKRCAFSDDFFPTTALIHFRQKWAQCAAQFDGVAKRPPLSRLLTALEAAAGVAGAVW